MQQNTAQLLTPEHQLEETLTLQCSANSLYKITASFISISLSTRNI